MERTKYPACLFLVIPSMTNRYIPTEDELYKYNDKEVKEDE